VPKRAVIRSDLIRLGLLWLCGACLRLTVLAIPPVVSMLHADLHLSETAIGWLSGLPPMLFAIAAIPGGLLIARFGILPALIVGLLINAVGSAARGAYPDAFALYASTIVMAAGVSIMQPALPPLVRAWFPERVGFATAVYTNGLLLGETLTVTLTIPLVLPLVNNSWRLSFVVWSAPVLLTALLVGICVVALGGTKQAAVSTNRKWWPDWRQPVIWRLGVILGSINAMYFAINGFMSDYMTAAGRADLISQSLGALNFCQVPASFIMLALAARLVKEPWAYRITGGLAVLCVVGMMTTSGYWIVFWCGVFGFVTAVTLVLVLALPSVLGAPDDVHRTSAGMFTISYSIAMVISVFSGWLWDLTHLPVAALAPAAFCGLVIVLLSSTVRRTYQPATAV
jgi:CP family cyanate transporter-like MFS transporter